MSEDYKIRVYVKVITRFSNNKLYSDITNLPQYTYIVIIYLHCKYIMYIVLNALPFLGTRVTINILIKLMIVIIDDII